MTLPEITQTLLTAKRAQAITFTELETLLERDEVWIAAVIYRQATADAEEAKKLVTALGLPETLAQELTISPVKG